FLFGAILLLAITQTALARDPALPPGSDFQTAIQGAHHLEKRGLIKGLLIGIPAMRRIGNLSYRVSNNIWYSPKATKYIQGTATSNANVRMTYAIADTVIRKGTRYQDLKTGKVVRVIDEYGGAVTSTFSQYPTRLRVEAILTPRQVKTRIENGRYQKLTFY
ncbi:MAG: hypothetical protein N0C91_13085, partial [Candidatus Thiodiazotropha endolucinida]|nr:hypothetical protein [Candidatus Thiodiazotropha taylori]MCW4288636.1 hypothetical protein [Candidatus Thiodiazotropha endolucinida]